MERQPSKWDAILNLTIAGFWFGVAAALVFDAARRFLEWIR